MWHGDNDRTAVPTLYTRVECDNIAQLVILQTLKHQSQAVTEVFDPACVTPLSGLPPCSCSSTLRFDIHVAPTPEPRLTQQSDQPAPPASGERRAMKRGAGAARHVLTVTLEDYYHVKAFNRLIHSGQWYRFENRLERNTDRTLDLLDETKVEGDILRVRPPGREHAGAGAEDRGAGSRGRQPRHVSARHLAAHAARNFAIDLARSKEAVEKAAGQTGSRLSRRRGVEQSR